MAAISSAFKWEIRSGATAGNVNGGGFKAGASGTDWSQQAAAQYALTTSTTSAANAIVLDAAASADMVGNIYHLISGTNTIPGWYEIISVVAGVSFTVNVACTSAAGASMVGNIGGAISLGAANDSTFFAVPVAGNTIYIQSGTYTLGQAVSAGASATALLPITVRGYQTVRGDNPSSFANCPLIDAGSNQFLLGSAFWDCAYLSVKSSSTTGTWDLSSNGGMKLSYSKVINTSTTAGARALNLANAIVFRCELISYRGIAVYSAAGGGACVDCYIHDSNKGFDVNNTVAGSLINCIVADCVTSAWSNTVFPATGASMAIFGCTFYGAENKLGTAILNGSSGGYLWVFNNIFYGFVTAFSNNNAIPTAIMADFNDYNNNTTNYTNQTAGANDQTLAPSFTNVTQLTGSAGHVSGSVLTDSGANFTNVVDNQDFCYIKSGTGATVGKYLITAHTSTTLTLYSAIGGSGTNIAYQVTLGHNFQIGTNLKALGSPSLFPAALTQSYLDIGAVQRQEPAGGSGMLYLPNLEAT